MELVLFHIKQQLLQKTTADSLNFVDDAICSQRNARERENAFCLEEVALSTSDGISITLCQTGLFLNQPTSFLNFVDALLFKLAPSAPHTSKQRMKQLCSQDKCSFIHKSLISNPNRLRHTHRPLPICCLALSSATKHKTDNATSHRPNMSSPSSSPTTASTGHGSTGLHMLAKAAILAQSSKTSTTTAASNHKRKDHPPSPRSITPSASDNDLLCYEVSPTSQPPKKQPRKYVYRCSAVGCNSFAQKGGRCCKHGAKKQRKLCTVSGCTNQSVQGGVCKRHGAKVKKSGGASQKRRHADCSVSGCTNQAKSGGVCVKHGAKVKRCDRDGCNNQAVKGGVCVGHGAKVKRCCIQDCPNQAVKKGVCIKHGARSSTAVVNVASPSLQVLY